MPFGGGGRVERQLLGADDRQTPATLTSDSAFRAALGGLDSRPSLLLQAVQLLQLFVGPLVVLVESVLLPLFAQDAEPAHHRGLADVQRVGDVVRRPTLFEVLLGNEPLRRIAMLNAELGARWHSTNLLPLDGTFPVVQPVNLSITGVR